MYGAERIGEPGALPVFHLDVRFDEQQIVMNTMIQPPKWGPEERVRNPFALHGQLHLIIRVNWEHFDILANHKKIYQYNMRFPISAVKYITVTGDIDLDRACWSARVLDCGLKAYPVKYDFPGGHFEAGEWFSLIRTYLPFRIAGDHNRSGEILFIYGRPKGRNFQIDLLRGNGDILFNFKVDFDKEKIVRNALIDGRWGIEEHDGPFPFEEDTFFDLGIYIDNNIECVDCRLIFWYHLRDKMIVEIVMSLCISLVTNAAIIGLIPVPLYDNLTHIGDAYVTKFVEPLKAGQMTLVYGRIWKNAKSSSDQTNDCRFSVDLMRGAALMREPDAEAVLHFDVRFDEAQIVMKATKSTRKWGGEERISNRFEMGRRFHLTIRTELDKLIIWANHEKIYEFIVHYPLSPIEYMTVQGDVTVEGTYCSGYSPVTLPFQHKFRRGRWINGQRFIVYGRPKKWRFEINLRDLNGVILFHFNPRLDEKDIVRNAQIGPEWGREERGGPFPFKRDTFFDLQFYLTDCSIQVTSLCISLVTDAAIIGLIRVNMYDNRTYIGDAYVTQFVEPLKAGQMALLYGRVLKDAKRFSIDLLRGAPTIREPEAEAVLHLVVRFDEDLIFMNAMKSTREWSAEDRISNEFRRARRFHLAIRTELDRLIILVNHKKIYEFMVHYPLSPIEYMTVQGDVKVENTYWSGYSQVTLPFQYKFKGGHWMTGERFIGAFFARLF
ncbi:unnamed protein product [Anisakis simplex]|uniref:Galectin n=1 Tax=Anisakis simplex TaxID=6269 RepID=A0A0M3K3U4_ANISI|nr:unnamed protein product [Anisakis simplex]